MLRERHGHRLQTARLGPLAQLLEQTLMAAVKAVDSSYARRITQWGSVR